MTNASTLQPDGSRTHVRGWTFAEYGTLGAVLFAYLLPRLLLGEGSIISTRDTLDNEVVYHVLISAPARMWSYHAQIPELLGGLPRWTFPPPLRPSSLLFWVLPPFPAYVVLELCMHSIAFVGMNALLRDFLPKPLALSQRLMIAATFALLPFYIIYDASITGQPMVAWALLSLHAERSGPRARAALLALFSFGFISVLPTSGAFVVASAFLVATLVALWTRRIDRGLWLGLATLTAGCVLGDTWFFRMILNSQLVSHRSVWFAPGSSLVFSWKRMWSAANFTFLYGRYRSASSHGLILVATAGSALVELLRRRWRSAAALCFVLALAYVLSFSEAVGSWERMRSLWNLVPFLRTVHLRFHWLLPTFWFVTLGVLIGLWSGDWIQSARHKSALAARALSCGVLAFLIANLVFVVVSPIETQSELFPNYRLLWARAHGGRTPPLTYREFTAHKLFAAIDRYIGKPKSSYHVVSIGLHPGVAAMSGFQCADGYHDTYPLSYKLRFEKLIAPELARDKHQRRSFEDWGHRAYVFVAHETLAYMNSRQSDHPVRRKAIALDPSAYADLKIEYVFSAYELKNPRAIGLRYEKTFTDPEAAWRVFLYKVVAASPL